MFTYEFFPWISADDTDLNQIFNRDRHDCTRIDCCAASIRPPFVAPGAKEGVIRG
jgi:hypothetical protein